MDGVDREYEGSRCGTSWQSWSGSASELAGASDPLHWALALAAYLSMRIMDRSLDICSPQDPGGRGGRSSAVAVLPPTAGLGIGRKN